MGSEQIFLLAALVSTGVFLLQFILSLFLGDMDVDTDVSTDLGEIISFKGLVHFGIGFSWTMYLSHDTSWKSYLLAILTGLAFVLILWKLYVSAYRLQKIRYKEDPKEIVGRRGTIYVNKGNGRYVIQVSLGGALRELDVVSASQNQSYQTEDAVTIIAFENGVYLIR